MAKNYFSSKFTYIKWFLVSTFFVFSFTYAAEQQESGGETTSYQTTHVSRTAVSAPAEDAPSHVTYENRPSLDNFSILTEAKQIKFMKNPCFNSATLAKTSERPRFSHIRGFGFENGRVILFKADGKLGYSKYQYESLYQYLNKNKLCSTKNNRTPKFDFNTLLIWN